MRRNARAAVLGATALLAVGAVGAQSAHADVQKCWKPSSRTITVGKKRGTNITVTACVLRTTARRAYKAWVTTDWNLAKFHGYPYGYKYRTYFDHFWVGVRLEQGGGRRGGDPNIKTARCDIAKQINSKQSGRAECSTNLYPAGTLPKRYRSGKKSADGTVRYSVDHDGKGLLPAWSLHGSPLV